MALKRGKLQDILVRSNVRLVLYLGIIGLLFSCSSEKQNDSKLQLTKTQLEKAQSYGQAISKKSFIALSSTLKEKIATKGLDSAIHACQLVANPIIDSISEAEGVEIRRIAKRTRNRNNGPNKQEKHLIKLMERAQSAGEKLSPFTFLVDSSTIAYYQPILIQPLCLNCHGEPGVSMQEETYETILNKYPMDKAIGYKLDELRGLWAINFNLSKIKE